MTYDHILLVGFGGPERQEDIIPYLQNVTKGRNIPEARLQKVADQYEQVGYRSRYNEEVFHLQVRMLKSLKEKKVIIPVFVGMRNWKPFLPDTIRQIKESGLKKGAAIILSAQRSIHSCYQYKQNVWDALKETSIEDIEYEFFSYWHDNPYLIEANQAILKARLSEKDHQPYLLFAAHSIPESSLSKCNNCDYAAQIKEAAAMIMENVNQEREGSPIEWEVTYHSRSGNPRDPWLSPDISETLEGLKEKGVQDVLVVPIGFFFENAEIEFDLDIQAKADAEKLGINFERLVTINHSPLLAEGLLSALSFAKESESV